MTMKDNKFLGGIWIGWSWANSWPNGSLRITKDTLVLCDEMLKKCFTFAKNEVTRIEIKKFLPVIGCSVRIYHTNHGYNKRLMFWYLGFQFNKVLSALKECGWIEEKN